MNDELLKKKLQELFKSHPQTKYGSAELSDLFKIRNATGYKILIQSLANLENSGIVTVNHRGRFMLKPETHVVLGQFHGNERGFGFVDIESEDQDEPSIFIPPTATNFALDGDSVSVEIVKNGSPKDGRGPEGRVVEIINHGVSKIVGEFHPSQDPQAPNLIGYVIPGNKKLTAYPVYIDDTGVQPEDGDIVVLEITAYPDKDHPKQMRGLVTTDLGSKDEPGMDILAIVYAHDIKNEFPEAVDEQANNVEDEITDADRTGRKDLTDQVYVTIDGESAKDLDDAVSVTKLANGNYHLGVSIADVSYYVTEGSALDDEAFERGTSVYLTDRVIPMLPKRLSNGICSLNPKVDRLTMTCEMEISPDGEVVDHHIFPSVIKTSARMTYTAVNEIVTNKDPEVMAEYSDLVPMFELMNELHEILWNHRHNRGSIDFEEAEAQIIVDPNGKPIDIVLRDRGISERMIESFMLAANETVAEHFFKLHVPFIYRIHETPDADRMTSFFEFVTNFGIIVKGSSDSVTPKMLQNVLAQIEGTPEEPVVTTMMLRSMRQAKYSDDPLGHFGLAAEYYTHFTSPIRRYPDLLVHRLIRSYLTLGTGEAQQDKWREAIPEIALNSSVQERKAIDAERETDEMKKAEYMLDKVGETFDAVVSSVTSFGLFVELPNTVEGLVHISNMSDDYYQFIESQLAMVGEHTRKTYRIGQNVQVKLTNSDVALRKIDFELVPDENTPTSDLGSLAKPDRRPRDNNKARPRKQNSQSRNTKK